MGTDACQYVELPVVESLQGDLAFAEAGRQVPFPIARVFFVHGVPAGAVRGGHAHRRLEETIFCLRGRLDVTVDDGRRRRTFPLEQPRLGLYLPPLTWFELTGFSPETAYLVLASAAYDEGDYIRDHDEYLTAVGAAAPAPGS